MRDTDIAVVGAACRFPDAPTPERFWRNLDEGVVSTRSLPDEVFRDAGVPAHVLAAPDFVRVAATLADPGAFAAEFFGYPPREAELVDPAHRLFLETCWEALESSGHTGLGPTGVFAGTGPSNYSLALQVARAAVDGVAAVNDDADLFLGSAPDFLSSRIAYKLGLRGPSVSVQTACSSSLAAVHQAVLSLLSGECDLALAGGATVNEPLTGYRYSPGGLTSEDGCCRAFDVRSTGTSFSSGVGVVVLRRLRDAVDSGDPILAVVRGTAVGNDGAERSGFTAPSPSGVASIVRTALSLAGGSADDLRYVEAHGSGTPLGDQIELRGLIDGLRASGRGFCALGSVKVNIGHCGPSAGIAGFLKAVHVARTGSLPFHPLFQVARDPGLLAESPFHVPTSPSVCADDDRLVLVNSMGLGGTTAAAVLAPPPAPVRPSASNVGTMAGPSTGAVRLVISARTRGELDALSRSLADVVTPESAADVAHTLRVGRRSFAERRVVTAPPDKLAAALRLPRPPLVRTARVKAPRRCAIVVAGGSVPPGLAPLVEALRAEVVAEVDAGDPRFVVLPPHSGTPTTTSAAGAPQVARHELGTGPDALEAAAAAAWLAGVDVDWKPLANGSGRRLALPTYPFTRRRFWALDRLDPVGAPPHARAIHPPTQPANSAVVPANSAAGQANSSAVPAKSSAGSPVPPANSPAQATNSPAMSANSAAGPANSVVPSANSGAPSANSSAGPANSGVEAGGSEVVDGVVGVWRELFGVEGMGVDDEFGALGGTSLLSVRMVLEVQRRFDVLVNVHRAGGSKATPRRMAEQVLRLRAAGGETADQTADGDGALVDADLALPLGEQVGERDGDAVLLTGATGYLGAFLLHELVRAGRTVRCLVRVGSADEGRRRLAEAARRYGLPVPDGVVAVPGDLRDVSTLDGLSGTGLVLHCAARVVFTEPYRVLREDNLLPMVGLLRWMRANGIRDFGFVSTVAATGEALDRSSGYRTRETREQPLDPRQGGYGVSKWVGERILERAERDGMRVRVFRPGWILGSTETGACNPKDLIWHVLASGLAVGAHPMDDRALPVSPVDVVARAIVQLSLTKGSAGRVYHLSDETALSPRRLFELLGEAGAPTRPVELRQWQRLVAEEALSSGSEVLSNMALYELDGHQVGPHDLEAQAWRPWLGANGLDAAPTGEQLRRSLDHLAATDPRFAELAGGARHSGSASVTSAAGAPQVPNGQAPTRPMEVR